MQERTAYRKYRFGHSARCVQWPYPVVSISVASRLWLILVAMFFRHESVLLFPPGLPPRSCVFCELFRSCRRSGRCCWREYRWHIAWQFVVHVLWFGVEWPVRLPLEAEIFLFLRRIAVNLSSYEDHVTQFTELSSELCITCIRVCFCTIENCECAVYQNRFPLFWTLSI